VEYKYINPEYIESVSGGDSETIHELVSIFKDQIAEISDEMRSLYSQKDYYSLGLLAHKAKSSVAIMGMEDLAIMLKTFELQAKESIEPEKYLSYITRFESDTKGALSELVIYTSNY
jgi:HPt (histidine-containing phosphotransfer) domain-containing protein